LVLNKQDICRKYSAFDADLKDHNAKVGEDEEASLGQHSWSNSGASVGVQRVVTKETVAYTHAKSKEVEIKIEGEQTQMKLISECNQQNGKLPIGKKDTRKKEPHTPKLMRGRDRPIAAEYSPKLTLLQNSKVRSTCGRTTVTKHMRVLTEFVKNKGDGHNRWKGGNPYERCGGKLCAEAGANSSRMGMEIYDLTYV
jgi:hypothetical protein